MSAAIERGDGRLAPGACGDPECIAKEWHYDYDHVAPARDKAADEVARIAWWLRAGLDGPAMPLRESRELLESLADKLESGERPWADAPTQRYPR